MSRDFPTAAAIVTHELDTLNGRAAPLIVDGVVIPPAQHRTRAMMETNLLLNLGGQFPAHDYLASFNLERAVFGYAGVFNRATFWAPYKSTAEYLQHGNAGPEGGIDHEAPNETACRAIGSLLANPTRFGGVAKLNPPLVLDIEDGFNVFRPTDTPDERLRKIKDWRNALGWIRAEAGQAQEIWYYDAVGYDTPTATTNAEVEAAMAEWRAQPEQYDGYFYLANDHLLNPTHWYASACDLIARIRKVQPTGGVVTLNPSQNVFWWDQYPDLVPLNDTPLDLNLWCAIVTLFAAAKLTLVLWTGGVPVGPIKPHCAFFAQHQITH